MNKTRVYLVITYFTIFVKFVRLNCFFPPPAQIMITSASFKMVSIIFSNNIIYNLLILCWSTVVTIYLNIAIKKRRGKCPFLAILFSVILQEMLIRPYVHSMNSSCWIFGCIPNLHFSNLQSSLGPISELAFFWSYNYSLSKNCIDMIK